MNLATSGNNAGTIPRSFVSGVRPLGLERACGQLCVVCCLALLASSSLSGAGCSAKVETSAKKKVSYRTTAKQNYHKGMKALGSKSYEDAAKYFKFVQTRFPFSQYATLAELRQADVLRDSEKFISAIDAYKTFIKEHPTHPEVESGYVAFNIGVCYQKLMPSDFFIMPPSEEKDQTSTEAAMLAFQEFLKSFPDSKYRSQAKKHYKEALGQLAAHELFVARYYLGRKKPKGAIFRLEYLIKKYPDAGVQPEVMFLLGRTYLGLKEPKKAQAVFQDLVRKHPEDFNAKKARRYLAFISREYGLK
ncbi:MAG: outer membrane protein assembly factor BamD [Polyangia bacterium]|jgi:outer membrane protein assembly factor BamD|nr:outer membrane protein assembly factor BamD [Polyangia bacterium]